MNDSTNKPFDICLKFIIIGNSGTGKSCLLKRFLDGEFDKEQTHTIGVEFGAKIVKVAEKDIKLQIWDTAGAERYRSVTRSYYRGAVGALIVYDVTNIESFKQTINWLNDAKELAGPDIVCILLGNKCDCAKQERVVSKYEASEFAQKNDLLFYETSALTGENVNEAFLKLTKTLITKIDERELDVRSNPRGIFINPKKNEEEESCFRFCK